MVKSSWIKTTVGWEKKKIIWLRAMKGDTPADILRFIDLNRKAGTIYEDMPADATTIRKVIKELESMPKGFVLRVIDEMPETVYYFVDTRPDLKLDPDNLPPVTRLVKEEP